MESFETASSWEIEGCCERTGTIGAVNAEADEARTTDRARDDVLMVNLVCLLDESEVAVVG